MQNAGVVAPTGSQIVKVSFKDGENLAAETRGFLVEMTGLYLYLTVEDGKIQRTFIPTHAYADYSIGQSLGEVLAAQQKDTVDFVAVGLQLQRTAHSAHRRLSYRLLMTSSRHQDLDRADFPERLVPVLEHLLGTREMIWLAVR